jgi:hypothetical protein
MTETTFSAVITVAVPVTDQDRTKSLLERLGFESRMDTELAEGFRWVELGVGGVATTLSLVRADDELPAGIDTGVSRGFAARFLVAERVVAVAGARVFEVSNYRSSALSVGREESADLWVCHIGVDWSRRSSASGLPRAMQPTPRATASSPLGSLCLGLGGGRGHLSMVLSMDPC